MRTGHESRGAIINKNLFLWIGIPVLTLGCNGCNFGLQTTPPPSANAPPSEIAVAGAKVMIGAGDIGNCGDIGDEGTAKLVDSVLRVNAAVGVETVVFTIGDHAYPMATDRQMRRCFTPSWGDSKKRIMAAIRPSIGNHDWQVGHGRPYYQYFGPKAGEAFKGYYSYDLGDWHVVVLNSELAVDGNAPEIAAQEAWLRDDLEKKGKPCTVSYFHRPLYSSAYRQGVPAMRPIWNILYENNVDLVLNGHDHHYERFLPQNAAGQVDSVRGIEQIIIGTGGAQLRGFKSRFGFSAPPPSSRSVARIQGRYGVLKVTLGASEYRTAFIENGGRVWDLSGGKCH
jgi:hypothetical protein